jgi:hypothetical protein
VVRKECYYYSFFGRDVWFGDYDRNDEVFAPFGRHQRYAPVFGAVSRLFTRCRHWSGDQVGPWWQESSNCRSAACGNATGRNIHQRSLDEAVRLTKAISAITLADYTVADAMAVFEGKADFSL